MPTHQSKIHYHSGYRREASEIYTGLYTVESVNISYEGRKPLVHTGASRRGLQPIPLLGPMPLEDQRLASRERA